MTVALRPATSIRAQEVAKAVLREAPVLSLASESCFSDTSLSRKRWTGAMRTLAPLATTFDASVWICGLR